MVMKPRRARVAQQSRDVVTIDWRGHKTLSDCSPEIMDRICHAVAISMHRRNDLTHLLPLLRVRPLSAAAERYIYRRLAMDLSRGDQNEKLFAALDKKPELEDHVRRISLRRTPYTTSRGSGASDLERSIALLRRCRALTDLEIRSRLRHSLAEPMPSQLEDDLVCALRDVFSNTLKRLVLCPPLAETIEDLTEGRPPTRLSMKRPFLAGLAAFSSLSVLDLWEVSFGNSAVAQHREPTFRLQRLTLNRVTLPGDQLSWLLSSTARSTSLVSLELTQVGTLTNDALAKISFLDAMTDFLRGVAPTLQRLVVREPVEGLLAREEIIDVFRNLCNLVDLAIGNADVRPEAWSALPLTILQHRLRNLSLSIVGLLEPASVVATVGKIYHTLHRVAITTRSLQPFADIPLPRPGPNNWLWSRQERRALRARCSSHGILLEIDGLLEPDEAEMSSAEEGAEDQISDDENVPDAEFMDELFVLDDERRQRYEEELRSDFALLEEARRCGDDHSSSADDFLDAPTSEGEDL